MYTSVREVRDTLRGDTRDVPGTAADLDDVQIQIEIDNAAAQVNATLRGVYTVPFALPHPQLIQNVTRDIAAYLADLNYRKSREYESDNYPIIRRYDRARELLEWLRSGVISLSVVSEGDELDIDDVSAVTHMYTPRLMTEDDIFAYRSYDY